ncbi:MAG: HAD family hydrolase [Kiritimatiellia bacterium]
MWTFSVEVVGRETNSLLAVSIVATMNLAELRLIVTDMDGTLLDGDRQLPRHFQSIVKGLSSRGIDWVIASGRQFENLFKQFNQIETSPAIIAENGALVYECGETLPFFSDLTPVLFFADVLREALAVDEATVVLCGQEVALVSDLYLDNFEAVSHYFSNSLLWHKVSDVAERSICKVAVYHPAAAKVLWPRLAPFANETLRVILSSPHWIDIQPMRINKGHALSAFMARRGVRPDQVMVFGDYLNDVEMMTLGVHAVAMGNAHPDLRACCPYSTRANTDDGVMWYLRHAGVLR